MDMRELTPDALFAPYAGHEAVIASFAARMAEYGLEAAEVGALYEQYMADKMADMIPATEADRAKAARAVERARGEVRRRPGQADAEHRLGACPQCGSEVWGIKKCPHISPPWRTFFACDSDDCAYHGRSRLTVEALRRKWPEGAEVE